MTRVISNKIKLLTFITCVSLMPFVLHASSPSVDSVLTAGAPVKDLTIEQNTAQVIKFPEDLGEIFIANPDIADVQVNNSHSAYIFAKKPGETTIVAASKQGKILLNVTLSVTHNLSRIKRLLSQAIPQHNLQLHSSPKGIIMEGSVPTPRTAKDAENIVSRFLTAGEELVNNAKISSPMQVYLKVKIAEIDRTVLNSLGFNWNNALSADKGRMAIGLLNGRTNFFSSGSFAQNTTNTSSVPGSIGANFFDGRTNIGGLLDALQQENLATILAEPNLVAMSGETASFLSGGEFPYPVPQQQNVTIEFKQFGISLAFTPTVLSPNLINLRVRPEVSNLDYTKATTLNIANTTTTSTGTTANSGSSSMIIPAISTRRADTTIELGSGQSFAIAGLFQNNISNSLNALPGLGDIPILGALFRSTQFQRNQTELVIIVTPYIVRPTQANALSSPLNKIKFASPLETFMEGRLNRSPDKADTSSTPLKDASLEGNAGFYID